MEKPKENFKSKIALCEQKLKLINDQNIKLAKELGLPSIFIFIVISFKALEG